MRGQVARHDTVVDGQERDLLRITAAHEQALSKQLQGPLNQHSHQLNDLLSHSTIKQTSMPQNSLPPCCPTTSDTAGLQSARRKGDRHASDPPPNGRPAHAFPISEQRTIDRWYAEAASDQPWNPIGLGKDDARINHTEWLRVQAAGRNGAKL